MSERRSRTPEKPAAAPTGSSSGAIPLPKPTFSSATTRSTSARSLSHPVSTTRRGSPRSSHSLQASSVPTCTPSAAPTTTRARSATCRAASTWPSRSGSPGQSRSWRRWGSSAGPPGSTCGVHVSVAVAVSSDPPRSFSSGSWSQTVVPSSTRPRRPIAPPVASSASTRVVFPDPVCPTTATVRTLSGGMPTAATSLRSAGGVHAPAPVEPCCCSGGSSG